MGHQRFQSAQMVRSVLDYETHHGYDPSSTACDIGIMFLDKPVQFSKTVKKVLLMKTINYKKDSLMEVAGWGAWSVSEYFNHQLKNIHNISNEETKKKRYIDVSR